MVIWLTEVHLFNQKTPQYTVSIYIYSGFKPRDVKNIFRKLINREWSQQKSATIPSLQTENQHTKQSWLDPQILPLAGEYDHAILLVHNQLWILSERDISNNVFINTSELDGGTIPSMNLTLYSGLEEIPSFLIL